jgi:hypothetical protein
VLNYCHHSSQVLTGLAKARFDNQLLKTPKALLVFAD